MKKYRAGKIKREHSVIEKLWPQLERIAACDLIDSIIPGPISPLNAKGFEITFQRFTETGLRLLAKNGSAVQEVYAITTQKEAALSWLAAQGIVDWQPPKPASPLPAAAGGAGVFKTVQVPHDTGCVVCGKLIHAGIRAVRIGKGQYQYAHVRCAK